MRTVVTACLKPVAALLLLALAGCATPIIYHGSEINPGMPLRIGDEITVTEKSGGEKYPVLVTAISETALTGSLVENRDQEKTFAWTNIREIDAGMSAGITFKHYAIVSGIFAVAFCLDDDAEIFGSDFC